jgi:hypothetical protein
MELQGLLVEFETPYMQFSKSVKRFIPKAYLNVEVDIGLLACCFHHKGDDGGSKYF